jgi:hypothetical protein
VRVCGQFLSLARIYGYARKLQHSMCEEPELGMLSASSCAVSCMGCLSECACVCEFVCVAASVYVRIACIGECACVCERGPVLQNGQTPLFAACQNGHLEVFVALLAEGADVEGKTEVSILLLISLTHAHAECSWPGPACQCMATFRGCTCISESPLLSPQKGLRLQGLCTIANTRLGQ